MQLDIELLTIEGVADSVEDGESKTAGTSSASTETQSSGLTMNVREPAAGVQSFLLRESDNVHAFLFSLTFSSQVRNASWLWTQYTTL